jgi:heme/copper-type cytochrome/quinol oxidase subunit 2
MGDRTDNRSATDQERFDREVAQKGGIVLALLGGATIFAALVISLVALLRTIQTEPAGASNRPIAAQAPAAGSAQPATAATTPAPPQLVSLKVIPEGKRGPEGKLHDIFTVTEFHVRVGQPVTLRIDNTDTAPHTITSPGAGVNITVQPGTHDYTLEVSHPGKFEWNCNLPCDTWAMSHVGYMAGYITAT